MSKGKGLREQVSTCMHPYTTLPWALSPATCAAPCSSSGLCFQIHLGQQQLHSQVCRSLIYKAHTVLCVCHPSVYVCRTSKLWWWRTSPLCRPQSSAGRPLSTSVRQQLLHNSSTTVSAALAGAVAAVAAAAIAAAAGLLQRARWLRTTPPTRVGGRRGRGFQCN